MLKFLADENISPRVIDALKKEGFDALSVYDINLSAAPDEKILKIARKKNLTIITHDKDFGNLIHQFHQSHSGIILLRLKNQSPQNVILHFIPFIKKMGANKIKNKLVIFQEEKIRII